MEPRFGYTLRKLEENELDTLYRERIESDFPSAERPNLAAMHRHMQEGLQQIWVMTDGVEDAAYAVCAEANGLVLVTLLAVFKDMRGGGRGTALLELLKQRYIHKRAILLEVEDPKDAEDDAELQTRTKRIAFYERFGYRFLEGIDHVSFGVRLLIMALPLTDTYECLRESAIQDVGAIYDKVLPFALRPYVVTKEDR